MARATSPFGDGLASKRLVATIRQFMRMPPRAEQLPELA
jgi:hypothetical protein